MSAVTIVTSSTVNNFGIAGTTTVVTKPSGTIDGDLLVVFIGNRTTGSTANPTPPSGWTLFLTQTGSTNKGFWAYWKIASSEPSTWTWTLASSGFNGGSALRINGNDPITPIDVSATAVTGTGVTSLVFTDTITPTKINELLLFPVFASRAATGLTDISAYAVTNNNPSWIEVYDIGDNSGNSIEFSLASGTYTVASATGNSTATAGASAAGEGAAGMLIAINRQTTFTASNTDTQTMTDATLTFRTRIVTVADTQSTIDAILVVFGSRWSKITKSVSTWIDATRHQ